MWNTVLLTLILLVWCLTVSCDPQDQARIISHEGELVIQTARDKNITIRLAPDSRFMINDFNMLDFLRKASTKSPSNFNAKVASLPEKLVVLKRDYRRLTFRLARMENRTSQMPIRRFRNLQRRVQSLWRRVNDIHTKLTDNDCDSSPCKNGGTCYDLFDDFHCECPGTWTGKTCDRDVDECDLLTGTDLGCQNNAVCVNLPGSYRCVCSKGFSGTHCRNRGSDCSKSTPGDICANGVCVPANNELGYQCICDSGWKTDNVTKSCTIDVNECLEELVACHSTCVNLPGSFTCGACPRGYTGNGVSCRDIDECATNNGGCSTMPKVQCINTEGSHRCGNCPPGWTGDGRYCSQAESNACATNNICHPMAKCEYISNMMVCECPKGMTGSGYGPDGCTTTATSLCGNIKCLNGGTCVNNGASFSCSCSPGFDPPVCERRDPCTMHPCLNGGTCTGFKESNTFTCQCARGFSGGWCQNKRNSCGSVIRDRTGDLKHPPDGGEYSANEACAWVIRTDYNLILNVTFGFFDLESNAECGRDWLQINDGRSLATPLIGRFCGNQLPNHGNILSSQNTLFLWFRTDNSTNGGGFRLSWNSVPPICGGQLDVDAQGHGVIKSPGYPGKSPPNRDCEWTITAPMGKRILLRFFEVTMDNSANCTKDSLIIYDETEVLDHVCQTGIPAPKYTSSNRAKLHLHTDAYQEDTLFQVHFEVVEGKPGCGGLYTESSGKIRFTLDLAYCLFLIQQPAGTRIFTSFTKGEDSRGLASIKIYDGKSEDDALLTESFEESLPSNLTSSGNFMLIVVKVQDSPLASTSAVIYEANFRLVCGEQLQDPSGGVLRTPNYPKPYYGGLRCMYLISGPLNSVVHLNITDYDVSKYGDGCDDDADYIEVYYTVNGPPERHCKDVPGLLVAPSNHLRIDFRSNTNPQRSRGMSAKYHFEQLGCGGVLRDPEGSFKLQNPASARNTYCEWILEAPETHVISLDLLYTRMGTKCMSGEADLTIFVNQSQTGGRMVQSICGGEKRITTTLLSNLVTVFLKLIRPGLDNGLVYGIEANYTFVQRESTCGGNYSLLSGNIQSPGFPGRYFDSVDCIWVIHAPLGAKIELVPSSFSLESGSKLCENDYLEIRNGMSEKSPLIGKYCGDKIPPHIPSFTNHLYLHFHSDSSFVFPGFDIAYQQTATGCGGSLSSHTGSIASPHYPDISNGPVQCDWKITVSEGSAIDIRITKLSPEADFCSNNVLSIHDGGDALAKKLTLNCSSTGTVISLGSGSNQIFVRYNLPEANQAEGQQFYLEYKTNCQQFLDTFEGVIESPNFPNDYPSHLTCQWDIVGRKGDTIMLSFSHFELERNDRDCSYDVFEVLDMKGDEVLQTHKICRDHSDALTSDGNRLMIKFTSDFSDAGNGFRLEFKRNGCGGYLTRAAGSIASPNQPYSVDVDCEWLIETSPGRQIILDIFELQIETEKKDCSTNGLIVKNDNTEERNLLKECQVQQSPMTVTSHGSTMHIRFYSDSKRSRKYFKAFYRSKEAKCGGVYRGNSGAIMSPNYPQNYPENSFCEWAISVEHGYFMKVSFDEIAMPASDCSGGFVKIFESGQSKEGSGRAFCYENKTNVQVPTGLIVDNRLTVVFNSTGPPAKGFHMTYEKRCGGVLINSKGLLKSNVQDGNCTWLIASEGYKASTNVIRFECHCDSSNDTECMKTSGVTIGGRYYCKDNPPHLISSNTPFVIEAVNSTFIAEFSLFTTACGGALTSLQGSLASPDYPQSYPSNVECVWTIQAPPGNFLEMSFLDMEIDSSEGCNQGYLEVRERTSNGKLLGVFCSNTTTTDSLQAFEQFWIKFRSTEGGVGKGFKLSWKNAQVNEISGSSGQIQPPPIAILRFEPEPFQWRITVSQDNLIHLKFKEYNGGLRLYDGFDVTALPVEIQLSPWQVMSSTSVVFLISDNKMLDHFRIEWKALLKDEATRNTDKNSCNQTLSIRSGPSVNVSSPGYPQGYDHNLQCEWIVSPNNSAEHVVAAVYEVRLEIAYNCIADYLQISSSPNRVDWHEELKICDSPLSGRTPIAEIHGTPYLKMNFNTDPSINRTGFTTLLYTACGSNMTGSIGRIFNFDARSENCTWHIEVRTGMKIQFTFEFDRNTLKNSSQECDTYAVIRDGIDDGAPIVPPGRICANKQFNGTVFTTTNRAVLRYYMKPRNPFLPIAPKLWNLTYREYSECGGEVRLTPYSGSVNLSSPHYPNVPDPHTECVWIIVAPPGEAVKAEFVGHFDMNIRRCSQEFIEFRDGSTELAPQLGKYCIRPGTVRSSGNILYMRYLTDIAEPRNGFKVNVSLSTCGGTFTQYTNAITSPNYPAPGGYPANSVCDYVIKVTTYSRVNLTFIDIDLPFDAENLQTSDHIKIYQIVYGEGVQVEEELAVIYGNTTTMPMMQVDNNEVLVRLYSFKANTKYRGFKLKYERMFGVCFRDVSGESGVLTLNVTPKREMMFVLCQWKITVPKGQRVKLDVLDVISSSSDAAVSRQLRVAFYNDFQMMSHIALLNLANITTSPIRSSDNKMYVRIFGANTSALRRLQVAYSSAEVSDCPDDITADSGSLSVESLKNYTNYFCTSEFVLSGFETLAFNISNVVVEKTNDRYFVFSVRFKGEPFITSMRVLEGNVTNDLVAMGVKRGSVAFLLSEYNKVTQFDVTYKKHPCGGQYNVGQKFVVQLPNLRAEYGALDCAWHLMTASSRNGYDLVANFSFQRPCDEEYLRVHSGPSTQNMQVAKLCRDVPLEPVRLRSPYVYIVYHTVAFSPNSRVDLSLQQASSCGGEISVDRVQFLSFSSQDYKNNLECVWSVVTSTGFYLRLEFSGRFFIEHSDGCVKDYLEIRKFENGSYPLLGRYCGRELPTAINTTSQRLQVIFRSDDSITGDGFTLSFKKNCYAAFNVTTQAQKIFYPSRWGLSFSKMRCDYILQTDTEQHIQVKFNKLILGHRNRCSLVQLTAQKRSASGSLIELGPYCKNNAVTELRAKKYISLAYEAFFDTGGYEIEFWLDVCGGDITQPTWIQSLRNEEGDKYADNMNCEWNITAPVGQNIVIQFKYLSMEEHQTCSSDYVAIYQGAQIQVGNRKEKLCGNHTTIPPTVHIDDNRAVVVAVSDFLVTREGFMARIAFTRPCNERFTLTAANSPVDIVREYKVGSNEFMFCEYRIMAPQGFRVEFGLNEIALNPQASRCSNDCEACNYQEILDSVQDSSLPLHKYCSPTVLKSKLLSSFNNGIIRTVVDRLAEVKFNISLTPIPADCDSQTEYVLDDDGRVEISSRTHQNGLYPANVHCAWKITSKNNFEIRFQNFNLQNKSDVTGECLDYVMVTSKNIHPVMTSNKHCGVASSFLFRILKYEGEATADIVFHTNEAVESTGFTLVATNTAACNKTYNETNGLIYGRLDRNVICTNTIEMPENFSVNFYMPNYFASSNCSENYVRVYDAKDNSTIYESCRFRRIDTKIFTKVNRVRVELKWNRSGTLEIAFYGSPKSPLPGCGGNFETPYGYVVSPNYQEFKNASTCRWNFTTTASNRIQVYFDEFNMGSICRTDYVDIIDIADNGVENVERHYCGQNTPGMYVSSSNRIAVVSVATADFDGTGWKMMFAPSSSDFINQFLSIWSS